MAFEESEKELSQNVASLGFDFQTLISRELVAVDHARVERSEIVDPDKWVKKGLLRFHATRSTLFGLEQHLVAIHKRVEELSPEVVIFDPITNLLTERRVV